MLDRYLSLGIVHGSVVTRHSFHRSFRSDINDCTHTHTVLSESLKYFHFSLEINFFMHDNSAWTHTTVSPEGKNSLIACYTHTHTDRRKRRRCYLPRNGALNLRPEAHCAGRKIKDHSDHLLITDGQTDTHTHTETCTLAQQAGPVTRHLFNGLKIIRAPSW